MIKQIHLLFLLLFFYLNILGLNSQLFVNYNVEKSYSTFDQCGSSTSPCISLEDVGKRAILENKNGIQELVINIIGNINGSTSASFGNLYSFCGRLQIIGNNNQTITIDGSNSNSPFINIREDQYESCKIKKVFSIKFIDFINWEQTIVDININLETDLTPLDNATASVYFLNVNMNSLSSIISIYPKNVGDIFNTKSVYVYFYQVFSENLKSSTTLFTPNSNTNYLPPIYAVGTTLDGIPNGIRNSNFTTTPFIYLKSGFLRLGIDATIVGSSFCNAFSILINSLSNSNAKLVLENNKITTLFSFSEFLDMDASTLNFEVSNDNTPAICSDNNKQYLGNTFNDSFIVIKNSINYKIDPTIKMSKSIPFFIFNSSVHIFPKTNTSFGFYAVDSIVSFIFFNLTASNSSIDGSNSSFNLAFNETICGCPNCNFYLDDNKVDPIDCNPPTPTPTPTPTTTGVDATREPQPSTSSSTSSSSLSSAPKSNSLRNIVIIIVILGSASIASLVLFSIIYKKHKNKKYILNSISSSNTMSEEDNDLAGAAADNDVSPNLEPTTAYEDDDCAQLEQI
ncbi:hypothetical protein ACTA71_011806 [Dictyostelium dimigraforme]